MIIVGNGLSIDLVNRLELQRLINTKNLFANGDIVEWPDGSNEKGFLSYKYCRNLWNLGARPNMNQEEANSLIEDILSCANMIPNDISKAHNDNIYLNAYYELVAYLKQLFVYYDSLISYDDLQKPEIVNWGWYKLIKSAYDNPNFDKIYIISYNYDVFLERILMIHNIPFDIPLFVENGNKIKILKPHGSINFAHKNKNYKSSFEIRRSSVMYEATIKDFIVDYKDMNDNYSVNALIPPSGDSSRLTYRWAEEIRQEVKRVAEEIKENDKVVISGLSYWHVDRKEIDEVLTCINNNVHIYMVNPHPPRALNAVLSCVFEKYIQYMDSDCLGGII